MLYKYGMRLRGFAPLCQPMNGFDHREDDETGKYYDILIYNRRLTEKEIHDYELDELSHVYRITYEIVLDILADNEDEAVEIGNDMVANGDFVEALVNIEEI